MATSVNLNGIDELDFPSGVSSVSTANGVTTITLSGGGGGGVTSLNALTGSLSITSTGATITITPSGSTINIETAGGPFLPLSNPTFTGILKGPHYTGNGASPSVAVGAGSGAGGAASLSGTSTDTKGVVTMTVGAIGSGDLADVTFAVPYAVAPVVIVCQAQPIAPGGLNLWYVSSITTTGFGISFSGSISAGAVIAANYIVIG